MVARITGTETICSTIGDLRLDRRFDVVLMMSYLINVADEAERLRLLRTCAHHVRPGGTVLIQQQMPGMIHSPAVREKEEPPVRSLRCRAPARQPPGGDPDPHRRRPLLVAADPDPEPERGAVNGRTGRSRPDADGLPHSRPDLGACPAQLIAATQQDPADPVGYDHDFGRQATAPCRAATTNCGTPCADRSRRPSASSSAATPTSSTRMRSATPAPTRTPMTPYRRRLSPRGGCSASPILVRCSTTAHDHWLLAIARNELRNTARASRRLAQFLLRQPAHCTTGPRRSGRRAGRLGETHPGRAGSPVCPSGARTRTVELVYWAELTLPTPPRSWVLPKAPSRPVFPGPPPPARPARGPPMNLTSPPPVEQLDP